MKRATVEIAVAVCLMGGIVATGAALVSTKHESRRLFRQLEAIRGEQDRLQDDWTALTLEVWYLSGHARIDRIAREELGLVDSNEQQYYVEVVR